MKMFKLLHFLRLSFEIEINLHKALLKFSLGTNKLGLHKEKVMFWPQKDYFYVDTNTAEDVPTSPQKYLMVSRLYMLKKHLKLGSRLAQLSHHHHHQQKHTVTTFYSGDWAAVQK